MGLLEGETLVERLTGHRLDGAAGRPWFRFPLHTLFLITALGALYMARAGQRYRDLHAYRQAALAVESAGGYCWSRSMKCEQMDWVRILSNDITDEELAKTIAPFPQLPVLLFHGGEHRHITDRSAKLLLEFRNMRVLNLSGTSLTDRGLVSLAELPSLRRLYVARTRVTEAGLRTVRAERGDLELIDNSERRFGE